MPRDSAIKVWPHLITYHPGTSRDRKEVDDFYYTRLRVSPLVRKITNIII